MHRAGSGVCMRQCFEGGYRAGHGRTVLAIGIDNLSTLEELFGEHLGDEVVAAVGRRLAAAIPVGAGLCATRHRRFLLDLPGLGERSAAALFERLRGAAAQDAIETMSGPVAVTLSAGCAPAAGSSRRPEQAERAALQALQSAMTQPAGGFAVARGNRALAEQRSRLLESSRAAIGALGLPCGDGSGAGRDRLAVAFQPVVRAAGGRTIAFQECLARIRRADGSVLPAAAFMPALERIGLATLVDRQVLAMTLGTLARNPGARLSVNVYPHTMQDACWMSLFEEQAAQDPSLPERLIVEVTETAAVLDLARTRAFMDRLRRHGVAFALDDFGAGSTSIAHLRDLRFDIVKIDGRFVRAIAPGTDDAFLVGKLVEIARRFDMMTVAEGVQGPAEARCLGDLGVEFFQGFWFGCPSLVLEPTPTPMPEVAAQA